MPEDDSKRHIAILGSTGSIGGQALEVIRNHKDRFAVDVLTAENSADALILQASEFLPNSVVIGNEALYDKVFSALDPLDIKVYSGAKSISSIVEMESIDMVLTGMVGYSGLLPTIASINAKKSIALANKETMVVAGELITKLAYQNGVNIFPVDSEHSAIFQCLLGEFHNPIEKIYLTASGGPFRGKDKEFLKSVTKEQALNHPNWTMGSKITIDSATLMNKGLEVIEAKWLFSLKPEQIEVLVHPQSIIHSMVQFQDGSVKAQLGLPDMKLPIQFALGYPGRLVSDFPRIDFLKFNQLTFLPPDKETFRCLDLAYKVLNDGGNKACILNGANEIAVDLFLSNKIQFLEIPEIIENTISKVQFISKPTLQDYIETDAEARRMAKSLFNKSN